MSLMLRLPTEYCGLKCEYPVTKGSNSFTVGNQRIWGAIAAKNWQAYRDYRRGISWF